MTVKKLSAEKILMAIGNKFAVLDRLYVVGALQKLRSSRKDSSSPVSTNGWTEFSQANWKLSDGTIRKGEKSTGGAGYTKMLCGLRQADEGVTPEARLGMLVSIAVTRILPTGVGLSAAYALSAIPAPVLAGIIKELFGDQSAHVLAHIKASIQLATKCTELVEGKTERASKSGPIAL